MEQKTVISTIRERGAEDTIRTKRYRTGLKLARDSNWRISYVADSHSMYMDFEITHIKLQLRLPVT